MTDKPTTYFRRNRLRIVCIVMFMLPLIWMGTRRTLDNVNNNVKDWLPDAFEETSQHTWFVSHFPNEQFVLVSWEGCTLDDPRVEEFAQRLVPDQPTADTSEPTLDGSSDGATSEAAEAAESEEAEEDPSPFKRVVTGPRLVRRMMAEPMGLSRDEAIERLKGSIIGPDGESTCVLVTLRHDAVKGKVLRGTLQKIRDIATEMGLQEPPPEPPRNWFVRGYQALGTFVGEMVYGRNPSTDGIVLGGPPVDNESINYEGEYTLWRLAGLCMLVSLGISMACFRSLRLTAIVFWISLLSAGLAIAAVFFTGQTCDAVLLSMPALILVLAMSGAVHTVNYYHDAIRAQGLHGAAEQAVAHAWIPCSIAAFTTALGLGSLCMSHVVPISKFGMYSAFGVLATLLLLFFYLPALLDYFPSKRFAEKHGGRGEETVRNTWIVFIWQWFGGKIIKHNLLVSIGCIVMMIIFAAGLFQIRTSVKLMKLFSSDAEIIAHYNWLEEKLGPLVPMEVVVTFDNETCELNMLDRMRLVKGLSEVIKNDPRISENVGGVLSAATMGPDLSGIQVRGLGGHAFTRGGEFAFNKALTENRREFKDYLAVDGDPTLAEMDVPAAWIPRLEAEGFDSLKDIERRDREQPIQGLAPEQTARLDALVSDWQEAHGEELWRINTRVWALKRDIDYAVFVQDLKSVIDPLIADYKDEYGVDGVDVVYTGLVPLVYKTQHELLNGLVSSLLSAFVLISIVMVLVLKSPSAGLLSMLPNVFPVVMVFGAMGWLGILVDIGTMMTSTVALGIAVDDTIHYLTWFRHGLDLGYSRKRAALAAYERCATAMTQTTLIGGLGLAAFGFSTFTPTQRFGVLMLTLLTVALVGDLIFLPAILTGPLGRFFDRSQTKKPKTPRGPDSETVETILAVGPGASDRGRSQENVVAERDAAPGSEDDAGRPPKRRSTAHPRMRRRAST